MSACLCKASRSSKPPLAGLPPALSTTPAPHCLRAGDPEGKAAGGIGLFLAAVPIRPGWSRIMTLPISANTKLRKLAAILESLTWARHVWNHDVHDGDISVLHRQVGGWWPRGGGQGAAAEMSPTA